MTGVCKIHSRVLYGRDVLPNVKDWIVHGLMVEQNAFVTNQDSKQQQATRRGIEDGSLHLNIISTVI